MRPKIWKIEETELAFIVSEQDARFTFRVLKRLVLNYTIDDNPAFSESLHYFDLTNGQVLCFSEFDLMITDTLGSAANGAAVIVELDQVLAEVFLLIKETSGQNVSARRSEATGKLSLFANLGFEPAKDFTRIVDGLV